MSILEFSSSRRKRKGGSTGFAVDESALIDFDGAPGNVDSAATTRVSRDAKRGWSNQERADLARAESLILAARPDLEFCFGASDEGDPWCVVSNSAGDVLIHICRIEDEYHLDNASLPKVLKGRDLRALIDQVHSAKSDEEASQDAKVTRIRRSQQVYFHPSIMITALFWALIVEGEQDELSVAAAMAPSEGGSDDGAPSEHVVSGHGEPDLLFPHGERTAEADESFIPAPLPEGLEGEAAHDKKQAGAVAPTGHILTTLAIAAGFMSNSNLEPDSAMRFAFAPDLFLENGSVDAQTDIDTVNASNAGWTLSAVTDFLNSLYVEIAVQSVADRSIHEDPKAAAADQTFDKETATPSDDAEFAMLNDPALLVPSWFDKVLPLNDLDGLFDLAFVPSEEADDPPRKAKATELAEAGVPEKDTQEDTQRDMKLGQADADFSQLSQRLIANDKAIVLHSETSFAHALMGHDEELGKIFLQPDKRDDDTELSATAQVGSDVASAMPLTPDTSADSRSYDEFSEAAKAFLNARILDGNVKAIIYSNEIVFIDKSAFSGQNLSAALSWSTDDGGVVSFVGISTHIDGFIDAYA